MRAASAVQDRSCVDATAHRAAGPDRQEGPPSRPAAWRALQNVVRGLLAALVVLQGVALLLDAPSLRSAVPVSAMQHWATSGPKLQLTACERFRQAHVANTPATCLSARMHSKRAPRTAALL